MGGAGTSRALQPQWSLVDIKITRDDDFAGVARAHLVEQFIN